ncbi:hypothetical protein DUI87_05581 [Hirundo rustica rustica]|uniref:Uncharacterized protein n=1 Tax=Hirundo rustica rustica TaxID=333673 RepID=A0A3M0KX91_HIRRU|nr:hypothetical protein DUI87_05581 [Hirundo rustica rustica]
MAGGGAVLVLGKLSQHLALQGQEAASLAHYSNFSGKDQASPARQHSCMVTAWALSSTLTPVQAGRDTFPALLRAPSRKSSPHLFRFHQFVAKSLASKEAEGVDCHVPLQCLVLP